MTPQSPSKEAPWDLTQFSQSPSVVPSYFPESHQCPEISSLSKVILVWGKARSPRAPNLGCRGLSHLGGLMFWKKTLHQMWHMSRGTLLWRNCQSPAAHSCGLLDHQKSFRGGMFKLKAKLDADLLLYSVILNVMATQYTCSLSSIYHPHCLVQWSRQCSRMRIPVHSPWLPGYICLTNHSRYSNDGWTFSGQTSLITQQ